MTTRQQHHLTSPHLTSPHHALPSRINTPPGTNSLPHFVLPIISTPSLHSNTLTHTHTHALSLSSLLSLVSPPFFFHIFIFFPFLTLPVLTPPCSTPELNSVVAGGGGGWFGYGLVGWLIRVLKRGGCGGTGGNSLAVKIILAIFFLFMKGFLCMYFKGCPDECGDTLSTYFLFLSFLF